MGQAASKAREAHAQAKSRPKQTRSVLQQKIKTAAATGVLALPEHKLKLVPREVLALSNLRSLDLSSNRLAELPAELGAALPALRTLKLAGNALAALPDLSALTALTTVRTLLCEAELLRPADWLLTVCLQLVLDGNALERLPEALPPNLTKLSLKHNRLRELPPSVTRLAHLQELDVSGNELAALPDHVGALASLVDLTIDQNAVRELPAALARCAKLKVLSARGNRLSGGQQQQAIAREVLADSAVHIMNLERNPLSKADLEAMDGFESFLARRTQAKNKEIHGGLSADVSLCGLD